MSCETEDGSPDWIRGKKKAQKILEQYFSEEQLPELHKAAKEELKGANHFTRAFRDKKKRREMLLNFNLLERSVFTLHPLDETFNHPKFPTLEKAVVHACQSKTDGMMMLPAAIGHTIGPAVRATFSGHSDAVYCCAVYADGTRAISGSGDSTLRVWNLSNGEE
eukprot:1596596-Ditylum_brightwellii.AAC.1